MARESSRKGKAAPPDDGPISDAGRLKIASTNESPKPIEPPKFGEIDDPEVDAFNRASRYWREGNLEGALSQLSEALRKNRHFRPAHYWLGRGVTLNRSKLSSLDVPSRPPVFVLLGDDQERDAATTSAIRGFNNGRLRWESGALGAALDEFRAAQEIDPRLGELNYWLGYGIASRHLPSSETPKLDRPPELLALSRDPAAQYRDRRDEWDDVREAQLKAFNLATDHWNKGHKGEAIKILSETVLLHPYFHEANFTLGDLEQQVENDEILNLSAKSGRLNRLPASNNAVDYIYFGQHSDGVIDNGLNDELNSILARHGVSDTETRDNIARKIKAEIEAAQTPTLKIPDHPPKRYVDRPRGQNIIDFLQDPEGWGPYIQAQVLTRPVLRQLDKEAYDALTSWLQRHENRLPPGIVMPSKSEIVDRSAAMLASAGVPKEAVRRVGQTLARRSQRQRQP